MNMKIENSVILDMKGSLLIWFTETIKRSKGTVDDFVKLCGLKSEFIQPVIYLLTNLELNVFLL